MLRKEFCRTGAEEIPRMPQHRTSEIDAGPLVNVGTNNTWTTLVVGLQQLPPNSGGLKLELPSVNEDLDLDTPCEVYCRRTEAGRRFTVYLVMILVALFRHKPNHRFEIHVFLPTTPLESEAGSTEVRRIYCTMLASYQVASMAPLTIFDRSLLPSNYGSLCAPYPCILG